MTKEEYLARIRAALQRGLESAQKRERKKKAIVKSIKDKNRNQTRKGTRR